jgi:hypothetical protein
MLATSSGILNFAHAREEITAGMVGVDVWVPHTASAVMMPRNLFIFFLGIFFPVMSSATLSKEDVVTKIQDALQFHKTGDFQSALRLYDDVIPHLSGKLASQICGNAGAIHLQQGNPLFGD